MAKNKGTVVQIMGPVLDIRFGEDQLPSLLNAIEVPNGDKTIVAEVASISVTMWSAALPCPLPTASREALR